MDDLTPEERRAIAALKRLARRWPPSLWLFSASGTLTVMRFGDGDSTPVMPGGGADPAYIVDYIHGIPNDGGDW